VPRAYGASLWSCRWLMTHHAKPVPPLQYVE
jgi:hypothetical protein